MPVGDGAGGTTYDPYLKMSAQSIFNSTEKLCIFTHSLTDGNTFKESAQDTLKLYLNSGRELYILAAENPAGQPLDKSIQKVMDAVFFHPKQVDVRIMTDESRKIMRNAFQHNKPKYYYVGDNGGSYLGVGPWLKSEEGNHGYQTTRNGPELQELFDKAFEKGERLMKTVPHSKLIA